ncbi:MAG: hypothetical protein QXP81_01530 [Nitrososphaerota archaeon]
MSEPRSRSKPERFKRPSYLDGYKYCSNCGVFIKTQEDRCPNCNTKLRMAKKSHRPVDPSKRISVPDDW